MLGRAVTLRIFALLTKAQDNLPNSNLTIFTYVHSKEKEKWRVHTVLLALTRSHP